jgi:iron complex transport system substrate-binding protein
VAVDKNSNYPSSVPRSTLDAYQLNAEAVAAYRPDLVIESGLTSAQLAQLSALKLPVVNEPAARTVSEAYSQLTELGRATGHASEAAAVVGSMQSKIAALVASTPKPAAGTSYYYELDQTYYSVTSSTFVGQLFRLLGLTSIADAAKGAAAAGGYPQLSSEYIVKSNPPYMFLADTKCCAQTPHSVAARPGWSVLSAVSGGRVVALDDDIASRWGPRVVELLQTIADALKQHPVR